ncbi:ricin-type beta-trefoil lectin domain protein [Basilea psittacipulmonis]|uniref:ricin-type beta-trefoil lectin domain protein n=1 Tax=Basilea psittacipulmonis TaxID=1472345 RepID=UPI00068FC349|nr:ricin-type beta-trefoil lectin domain protein [Basilea psittacipulmonis]
MVPQKAMILSLSILMTACQINDAHRVNQITQYDAIQTEHRVMQETNQKHVETTVKTRVETEITIHQEVQKRVLKKTNKQNRHRHTGIQRHKTILLNTRTLKQDNNCLDVSAENQKDVITFICHDGENQRFQFYSDGTIRQGGQCLDIAGENPAESAVVIMYACTGRKNQQWYKDGRQIRSVLNGKCLDTRARKVSMRTCTNSYTQRFY